MLMQPPPGGGFSTPTMSMGNQNTQLLGAGGQGQMNNPQIMRQIMALAGKGGFAHPGMGTGPTLGPVQQGPFGSNMPPQQRMGAV